MTDFMLLIFAIDLLGVWMYGSAALYALLCRHLLRRAPTGGAAVALETLVYVGTYCLVLGILGWLFVAHTLSDHARMPL